jgi:hypothetical protein
MEDKTYKANSSGEKVTITKRENFMASASVKKQDVLQKREEFAVNLRKQKTKEILQAKRRKIAEGMTVS